MSSSSSKSADEKYDLTHQGIWGIWTGQIGSSTPATTTHPGRSGRLNSPRNAYLSSVEPTAREPIRQGSAAWASLKSQSSQGSAAPSSGASTASSAVSGFRPRTLSSNSRAGRGAGASNALPQAPAPSDEYLAAVSGIYEAKTGLKGSDSLPSGGRTECRRMILALCEGGVGGFGPGDEQ